MHVWRLEAPDHPDWQSGHPSGPYGAWVADHGHVSFDGAAHQPAPNTDIYESELLSGDYVFGFETWAALDAWFDLGTRDAIAADPLNDEMPIRMRVYDVPDEDVLLGEHQLAFLPDAATLIEDHDLDYEPGDPQFELPLAA